MSHGHPLTSLHGFGAADFRVAQSVPELAIYQKASSVKGDRMMID
jgi:hypothetical protein